MGNNDITFVILYFSIGVFILKLFDSVVKPRENNLFYSCIVIFFWPLVLSLILSDSISNLIKFKLK